MTARTSAWMPFYVGDYLGDTQRLTTEQHGAYLLLILDYWRAGPAPDDDAVLAQITRLSPAAWKRTRAALVRFFKVEDGHWHHARIDRELSAAKDNAERRSSKAKSAAQARWGDATGNARSMPQALPEECPPPSPSTVPFPDGKETAASGGSDAAFWANAKSYLGKGKASLIGQWVRDHGKQTTASAIAAAQVERAVEPVEFIIGRLRKTEPHRPAVPL